MTPRPQGLDEIRQAISTGALSAVEVCQRHLDRIDRHHDRLRAFITVARDRALEQAARIDRNRHTWRDRPLLGVPIALKDNLCTTGLRTTAGSRILRDFVPPYSATVVTRLEAAGAIVLGKTNCDEFAMGSSTEHSAFGPTHNPWSLHHIPGGSSGGSAVAVAAGLASAALGSDTGGSIRQPAALCGVVGLKPTYGRVSRFGLIAFASSLDQVGPIARTVRDAALLLSVIAGPDPADATATLTPAGDLASCLPGDLRGATIGVPRRVLEQGVDEAVTRLFNEALSAIESAGARLRDIELPHAPYAVPTYYLIAPAEASSNLARYDGVRYTFRARLPDREASVGTLYDRTRDQGFGSEVKRRIMLGTYALSAGYYEAYYRKAQQVRTLIRRDYEEAFGQVDAVVMPTTPSAAFKIGEKADDPLQMYLTDVFTVSANLTGMPAISLPCGLTPARLPVGLQLVGRPFGERELLRLADGYERLAPPIGTPPEA